MRAPLTCITRAKIVLPDGVVDDASLLLEDGCIAAIEPERAPQGAEVVDLEGQWLMPGLVDLHCDALEKEIEPRPGVHFPLAFAIANADKRNACAGITTVYHAVSFAHDELGVRNVNMAADAIRAVHAYRDSLVDNRVHARYEITDPAGAPVLAALLDESALELLSFMDHSPGQGQFKTLESYRDYVVRTYNRTPEDAERMALDKIASREAATERVNALAAQARQRGVCLASHDDDSAQRVAGMKALGVSVSEFPVNLEAAMEARRLGLATVFGAPNILRGSSQSGNMRALEAVHAGVADCLCADYAPATMLPAAMRLPSLTGMPPWEAIRMVTRTPALAAGLGDRGEIARGLRADLIAVTDIQGTPQATHAWCAGRLTYRARYPG